MKLHAVTMMLCEGCLADRAFPCAHPGCAGSSTHEGPPLQDPLILHVEGFAMCCECKTMRAEHACNPGTEHERQYCRACFGPAAFCIERMQDNGRAANPHWSLS